MIAESTKKSDKLDAQTLAEFLALDWTPALLAADAAGPGTSHASAAALLHAAADYGHQEQAAASPGRLQCRYPPAVRPEGPWRDLVQLAISAADRFHAELLFEELDQQLNRRKRIDDKLAEFALAGSIAEQEARRVLKSIPGVAAVTTDVVLSEIGDIRRFSSQCKATAFAGLAPGIRETAGPAKHLGITKEGSRLLRWALVQTAWRLVN